MNVTKKLKTQVFRALQTAAGYYFGTDILYRFSLNYTGTNDFSISVNGERIDVTKGVKTETEIVDEIVTFLNTLDGVFAENDNNILQIAQENSERYDFRMAFYVDNFEGLIPEVSENIYVVQDFQSVFSETGGQIDKDYFVTFGIFNIGRTDREKFYGDDVTKIIKNYQVKIDIFGNKSEEDFADYIYSSHDLEVIKKPFYTYQDIAINNTSGLNDLSFLESDGRHKRRHEYTINFGIVKEMVDRFGAIENANINDNFND